MTKEILKAIIDTLAWLRGCSRNGADNTPALARQTAVCLLRLVVFVVATAALVYFAAWFVQRAGVV